MIIHSVVKLEDFDFWEGAVGNASLLTRQEFGELEDLLEKTYTNGISETELNDLFWFEFDKVCEMLGLDEQEVRERDVDC